MITQCFIIYIERDNKSQNVAQEKLKKAVMAVLILFAIKAALSGIQGPAELYIKVKL
ncbi:hypothetical protein [Ehrlichia ruminantium]|uniref:hypothetical protein n=1 Tax=Ehrlichia ruminantium TaxID=779 RepID=UPI0003039BCF|nr:hypothetical protein [Ehrlichia ruminantium]